MRPVAWWKERYKWCNCCKTWQGVNLVLYEQQEANGLLLGEQFDVISICKLLIWKYLHLQKNTRNSRMPLVQRAVLHAEWRMLAWVQLLLSTAPGLWHSYSSGDP